MAEKKCKVGEVLKPKSGFCASDVGKNANCQGLKKSECVPKRNCGWTSGTTICKPVKKASAKKPEGKGKRVKSI